MPIFLPLICLLGMGLARFWDSTQATQATQSALADPATRDDAPLRLLRWAAGLLSAQREEWGQAMLGELDHLDGRARRWRFAIGCAGAVLLLPPRGRTAAAVWAMTAVAAAGAGLCAFTGTRYGLDAGAWVLSAIALVLLVSYALAASVLARRPGVALPGLLGGLLVMLAWLAMSGFTFAGLIAPTPAAAMLVLLIVVPMLVGVAGTLWGGSSIAGRRIVRLASYSAGLGVFLYGTLAVTVLGAGGLPSDSGWTASAIVADRLGNNAVFYLWLLPLTTAALGWAAAAATARIHPRLAITAASAVTHPPLTTAGAVDAGIADGVTVTSPREARPVASTASEGRARRTLLLCLVVAAVLIVVAATLLKG